MDIRDLAYFESIATLGSLGRAAEALGRTKPALSKCIARLEEDVGAPLFERTGRLMVLTEPGRLLLSHAVEMRTAMAQAVRQVAEQADGSRGHLRIGVGTSIVEFLLPPVSAWLRAAPAGVTLDLRVGLNDALQKDLREDRLDGIITTGSSQDSTSLLREDWFSDDVVVVAATDHPLAHGGPVAMERMAAYGWVLTRRGVASREWLGWAFTSAGLSPPLPRVEIDSMQMVPAFIKDSHFLSFIPRRNLFQDRLGKGLQELPNAATTMRRQLSFQRRRTGYASPVLMRLARELQAALAQQGLK